MGSDTNMNEDLLVKHLLGEASEAEQREIQDWLNESAANRRQYEQFKLIWEASKEAESKSTVNVDDAWERFKERRANVGNETKVIPLKGRMNWVRVAAVLVILVGAGWMVYNFGWNNSSQLMAVNSGNSVLVDTLPDGSVVTLNKNSSISYKSDLSGATRSVKLEGEAFFNVAPDKEHPFVIDVNGNTVTVVGTSFNVKSTAEKTEVIVETGVVDVEKNDNKVTLRPKQKATIFPGQDAPVKESSTDELYNYYKTKEFVCRQTPLDRLVEAVNQALGANIVIENERLGAQRITTTFPLDLDEIISVLETQYNVQARREGDRIILQ